MAKVGASARTIAPALAEQKKSLDANTLSAGQFQQAVRNLPFELKHFFDAVASGGSVLQATAIEGTKIVTSFGGFGSALRGLATILTPTVLGIGGLAAAVGLSVFAIIEGERESSAFAAAIALSGNAAGVTTSQLRLLSQTVGAIAGTQGQAANALALLTQTGQVSAQSLEQLATVALKVQRTIGTPIEETVKQFAELGRDPVTASKKLNDQYNFLTGSVLAQIRALQDQGAATGAAELAQKSFGDALGKVADRAEESLGTIQQLGVAIAEGFATAKNALLSIGRDDTPLQKLQDLQNKLKEAQDHPVTAELFGDSIQELKEKVAAQEKIVFNERISAGIAASRAATNKSLISLQEDELKNSKELAAEAQRLRDAQFGASIDGIKRSLGSQLDTFKNSEAELDALHAARLIKDEDFFKRKSEIIDESTSAQVAALKKQIGAIAAENAADAEIAKKSIESLPVDQRVAAENAQALKEIMNKQRLRDLQAELNRTVADGASKQIVLGTEQAGENKKIEDSYKQATVAANQFLDALDRQIARETELQGAGNLARQRQTERDRLADQFEQQRKQLEDAQLRGQIKQPEFNQRKSVIDQTEVTAVGKLEDKFKDLDASRANFITGAREAFNNYLDDARDVSKQSEQLFSSAFKGAEDALVEFATTGKLNFTSLAQSILADLLRIQIQALIVRAIAGAGIFGGAGAAGGTGAGGGAAAAAGGALFADVGIRRVPRDNQVAILHKDEAVIPAAMNPFNPNARNVMGGGPTVNIVQNFTSSGGDQVAMLQMMQQAKQETIAATRAAISDDLRRGRLSGALQGSQR